MFPKMQAPKISPLQNTLVQREMSRRVDPKLTGPNPQLMLDLKPPVPKLKPPIPRMRGRKF